MSCVKGGQRSSDAGKSSIYEREEISNDRLLPKDRSSSERCELSIPQYLQAHRMRRFCQTLTQTLIPLMSHSNNNAGAADLSVVVVVMHESPR